MFMFIKLPAVVRSANQLTAARCLMLLIQHHLFLKLFHSLQTSTEGLVDTLNKQLGIFHAVGSKQTQPHGTSKEATQPVQQVNAGSRKQQKQELYLSQATY